MNPDEVFRAAKSGDLPNIQELLRERPERITDRDATNRTAMLVAAHAGRLETVKWLLREGGSHIGEKDNLDCTALQLAAESGKLATVIWLLQEGGSSIREANHHGWTALICAAHFGRLELVAWLLEHGGADILNVTNHGYTVWDFLESYLVEHDVEDEDVFDDDDPEYDATAVTALLRVMVLRGDPPAELTTRLAPEHVRVVQEGAMLRASLPAYLTRRQALLDMHCPLIAPIQDLVHGYEMPTSTDELWATGLGAARQRAARPRAENGAVPVPLRRSVRLHQKRE
jgi:hypothetical protein